MKSIDSERPIGWAYITPFRRERIEAGIKALARIDQHTVFYDWRLIGEALFDLCEAAKEQSGSNGYIGRGYNQAWARCVGDNPELVALSKVDSTTRTHAMWLAKNWDAVAAWHAELDDSVRRLINHPSTVRRRFDEAHPLPPKPKAGGKDEPDEPEDRFEEEGELDEDEVYDIESDAETEAPEDEPLTMEQWVTQFEALWRSMPYAVRAEIARRITTWLAEEVERADLDEPVEVDLVDEVAAEINRETAKEEGRKVISLAAVKAATSLAATPTPERIAMVVEEARASPLPEGADIFAGLGDDLGGKAITAELVLARRPTLSKTEAAIIAVRLNMPNLTDQAIGKVVRRTASTVRRVLDANGFGQHQA